MTHLVRLTRANGQTIWIAPSAVAFIEPCGARETVVRFAVAAANPEYLHQEIVQGAVDQVGAALSGEEGNPEEEDDATARAEIARRQQAERAYWETGIDVLAQPS